MSDTTFRFRQFTVHQDKCAMKVGTDAVLLGSWINPGNAELILDVGSGTGLIALMIAQKSIAEIDAIDIDENAYLQTKENFRISPWFFRLHPIHRSFQQYASESDKKYDLIVSNPPFFQHASKPNEESRMNARHNDLLTFDEIIDGVRKLLNPNGEFVLILPTKEGMDFMDKAQRKGLFCNHLVKIKTRSGKQEKRLIMKFGYRFSLLSEEEIVIQEEDGTFTKEYIELTSDYYIQLRSSPSVFPQS